MANFPKDRFDSVPEDLLRVGAHRAPARKGGGWLAFAWAALATLVLIAAGLYGLSVLKGSLQLPFVQASQTPTASATPKPTPTASPKLDATVPITVLNGTKTVGLATTVGDYLVKQGWTGAGTDLGTRANASSNTIDKTLVYYTTPEDEAAARALVQTLGVGDVRLSDSFNDRLTIVLGGDYKPQS
jgi:hypothetical protein